MTHLRQAPWTMTCAGIIVCLQEIPSSVPVQTIEMKWHQTKDRQYVTKAQCNEKQTFG